MFHLVQIGLGLQPRACDLFYSCWQSWKAFHPKYTACCHITNTKLDTRSQRYGTVNRAEMYGVKCPPKFNFWILLVFLAFDVVVLQFLPTSAIQHSSFQFLYSSCRFDIVCFTIQHCSLKYSTFKFTQFNIQVYSTLENACFWYPTAIQSMTVSVDSGNYQNSPLAGASKGRSLYPRQ